LRTSHRLLHLPFKDTPPQPRNIDLLFRRLFNLKPFDGMDISLEEIQTYLGNFMETYNNERTNQGKTPMQTLEEGRALYQKYVFENSEEEKNSPA